MILIGQYDSPFVRRVGIALVLYGLPFEHRPWSVFGDVEKIRPYNPLLRVPILLLDNGDSLIESHAILDYVDSLVPAETAMFPRNEPARSQAMRIASLATGIADKAVSLFYEKRLHNTPSEIWVDRCRAQINAGLASLEAQCFKGAHLWFGLKLGHADIAVATALRFITEAHHGLIDMDAFPQLADLCSRLESMPEFIEISQPFLPPT